MAKIEIDLDWVGPGESKPGGGTGETSIRQDAMRQVLSKLAATPGPEEPEQDDRFRSRPRALDVMPYRRHEAILVSARRGDGKTTFLTDVLRLIQEGTSAYRPYVLKRKADDKVAALYSLGIVDPTLIESKQNIVVIVIEKIKVAVDQAYRRNESAKKGAYEDFKRALRELAAGLTLLDGIGDSTLYGKDWADADYVLDRGLEKARSAGGFERAFHHYVRAACSFIDADAFVLAIDDVDTSFDKGWPVLEALRKYLATSRLKVILAGDLRLYNLLVRQQQWKQITKEFLDVEQKIFSIEREMGGSGSYADQLVKMVDVLQDQYLVKIVRPENRIELPPLLQLANQSNEFKFHASRSASEERRSERDVSERFAQRLLCIQARTDLELIRSTVLRLPMRSALQVMSGAWALTAEDKPPHGNKVSEDRAEALNALRQVASASLMSLDLDEYGLTDPNSGRVLGALSEWLASKADLWLAMSRFHPGGVDEKADLVSIRIAAQLVELFRRQPNAMIDYWLRICTIREKLDRGEVVSTNRKASDRSTEDNARDLHGLLEHVNAGTAERPTQFVSRLAAWDASRDANRGRQLLRGIRLSSTNVPAKHSSLGDAAALQLYGVASAEIVNEILKNTMIGNSEASKDRLLGILPPPLRVYFELFENHNKEYQMGSLFENGSKGIFANNLDSLENGLAGDARFAAMLPALRIVSGRGSENGAYSVLRPIAFVAEMLGAAQPEVSRSYTQNIMNTLAILRSYPTAMNLQSTIADDEGGTEYDAPDIEFEEFPDSEKNGNSPLLADLLAAWLRSLDLENGSLTVAPATLSRMWTRFAYSFDSIVAELKPGETRYLGVLMHRSITAFLHAVGVEALRAAGHEAAGRAAGNPLRNSTPLLSVLTQINKAKSLKDDPNIMFFNAMFSCPLWGYYLARSEAHISNKAIRLDAAAMIFRRYENAVKLASKRSPSYVFYFKHHDSTIISDGLFSILNSVYIQNSSSGSRSTTRKISGLGDKIMYLARELGIGMSITNSSN
ncbi:hypothetical protein [Methylorubrum sp. SL192]|uniref:hypothetical protein n=1 Tax=Methylorubrum sp. SL192 TaxID=2995167 RepID=UPI0022729ADB|nr:hypothetical protein [Methylorubrum sp. SL192]MCY1644030.1 hypothetical protein [Methylorubrum sp. SL192]